MSDFDIIAFAKVLHAYDDTHSTKYNHNRFNALIVRNSSGDTRIFTLNSNVASLAHSDTNENTRTVEQFVDIRVDSVYVRLLHMDLTFRKIDSTTARALVRSLSSITFVNAASQYDVQHSFVHFVISKILRTQRKRTFHRSTIISQRCNT